MRTRRMSAYSRDSWRAAGTAVLLLLASASLDAREDKVIQKSATNAQLRAADTYLDQSNVNTVNGALTTFNVQSLAAKNRRAIIQFDLSVLPNVGIKSAVMSLHVVSTNIPVGQRRTYQARNMASFWNEPDASWSKRVANLLWNTAGGGGDFAGANTTTARMNGCSPCVAPLNFDITKNIQTFYNGNTNYGTLIKDSAENNAGGFQTIFSSKEDAVPANRPSLDVRFVQNVTNLSATAGNGTITVKWGYPAAIGTILEPNTGVLIIRRPDFPVDKSTFPTDGADPGLCTVINGTGVVVFDNAALATSFADPFTECPGVGPAPANGTVNDTTWYYKVFVRDALNNYSFSGPNANGEASTYTEEISATPDPPTPASTLGPAQSTWMAATHATNLAAPSINPGNIIMLGSGTNLLFGIDPTTNERKYPAIALGGAVASRSGVIDSSVSSLAQNVMYVADADGLVYAVATDTGQILFVVNPTGLTTNNFQGGISTQLKIGSSPGWPSAHDRLYIGTHNGATTVGNSIVGIDGNTGATAFTTTGGVAGVPNMDIINSSAEIDYQRNAIWLTSRSNLTQTQPSLWKLDSGTGAVLFTADLGDIDSSPVLSPQGDVLFVGTGANEGATVTPNRGLLYAINPATGATLKSINLNDGPIVGFPVVVTFSPPYTVVVSGTANVHAVKYDAIANTFTVLWTTAINVPSTPIGVSGLGTVYVGSNDGMIHELNLATGIDQKQRVANTGQPGFVGDPTLDLVQNLIYVSTTDQRAYAFPFPF